MNRFVIGIGNFGRLNTRHNVGDDFVKYLVEKDSKKEEIEKNFFRATLCKHKNIEYYAVETKTFMNLSGDIFLEIKKSFRNPFFIVMQDEMDLNLGQIKLTKGGSGNGHNGIKDIKEKIEDDVYRVRIGIGRPQGRNINDYVIGQFLNEEQKVIEDVNAKLHLFFEYVLLWRPEIFCAKIK